MKIEYPDNPDAKRMVKFQLQARGLTDEKVNEAMEKIPRHQFVTGKRRAEAYGDYPLSIGCNQTISQPYMVAFMTEKLSLNGNEKVLEIGTGSGYQTAVLAELAEEIYTIERIPALTKRARALLIKLGYKNIYFRVGDGSKGWKEHAPYDRILVAAAASSVPYPLKEQLADNGILVIPIGESQRYQNIIIVRRLGNRFESWESIGCRFVPLVCDDDMV